MSHAASPSEAPFAPGPERIAVLRRIHSFGTAVGLAFWLGFFILLSAGLDGLMRARRAAQAAAEGLTTADFLQLNDLPAGLGLKTLALLIVLGLMFGLSCHQFNRQALEKLSAPQP